MGSTKPMAGERQLRVTHRARAALLAVGCALVVALVGASFWQAAAGLQALETMQLQAARTARLDSMLIQLVDAESGARGYLLSRNHDYLAPYLNSLATVEYTLDEIRQDVGPDPRDQDALARLTGLITLKLRVLADAVGGAGAGEEAPRRAGVSDGVRYMDTIRTTLAGLKSRMAAEGQALLEESTRHIGHTRAVAAVLALSALLLLGLLHAALRRELRLRAQLAGLLRDENARLEALVQARTADLSALASYLTRSQERERERIARELHDELGALLTAARMDAAALGGDMAPAHQARHARLLRTLDGGITLKRRIIGDLRPPLLQELGLVAALRVLAEELADSDGTAVSAELPDDEPALAPECALALFRIAQEALTNARRHAGARRVRLGLRVERGAVRLEVEDDGAGFDPAACGPGRHGLAGMRHRVQMFAGRFSVDSRAGAGTRIAAALPLDAARGTELALAA